MRNNNFLTIQPQYRQKYGLKNLSAICLVRGKYFDNWSNRQIKINLQNNTLQIITIATQKSKMFILDQVTYTTDNNQEHIILKVSDQRSYEIKNNQNLLQLLKDIDIYKHFKYIGQIGLESFTPRPQKSNYFLAEKSTKVFSQEHQTSYSQNRKKHSLSCYKRQSSFHKQEDWHKDKNGGLVLVNKQKKGMMPQIISFATKRIAKTGSLGGITLPTFALKPQSVLQTYCKCLGAAPLILQKCDYDPINRMKAFNAVILTMSIMFNDIQNGFAPALGETFQGQIGGNPVYAQQISKKPSLTAFLLIGPQYRIYGNLQLNVNLGLNQAVGVFNGEITLQFNDGQIIKGSMPKGVMSGVVFGETKFGPSGAVYSYDYQNQIVSSYEVIRKDFMKGIIGKLRQSSKDKFYQFLNNKKNNNFKALQEKDFESIFSRIQAIWTDHVSYDGKQYFNYNDQNSLPIKMTQDINSLDSKQILLPSDSNFRKDIQLRKNQNMKQSQKQNDFIESEQQRQAKLRQSVKRNYSSY